MQVFSQNKMKSIVYEVLFSILLYQDLLLYYELFLTLYLWTRNERNVYLFHTPL